MYYSYVTLLLHFDNKGMNPVEGMPWFSYTGFCIK